MKSAKRILIIEDDLLSANYIKSVLEKEGYEVVGIADKGHDGVKEAKNLKPDLILMDIMLKDNLSGCEAAVAINQFDSNIKIIFLTAYTEQEMIDYAIDSHALAYLVKPYRENEILATIKLLFAQGQSTKAESIEDLEKIEIKNGYIFDAKLHRLLKEDKEISLGKKPLKLIEILAKNKNISVSNEQICYHIWGEIKNDKTLRSLIYRIRNTLQSDFIKNINGLGYKIA
jgi:DNA-binding response OmpR family regulator